LFVTYFFLFLPYYLGLNYNKKKNGKNKMKFEIITMFDKSKREDILKTPSFKEKVQLFFTNVKNFFLLKLR